MIETNLPNLSLPRGVADLVVFAFPNVGASEKEQPYDDRHRYRHRADAALGRFLSKAREPDPE